MRYTVVALVPSDPMDTLAVVGNAEKVEVAVELIEGWIARSPLARMKFRLTDTAQLGTATLTKMYGPYMFGIFDNEA